jgi:hypothetical protein
MSQFSGSLNIWWLNRKFWASIPKTVDSLVTKIRKISLLPNIRDGAFTNMLLLTQGQTYVVYTQQFNDFLRRSRQQFSDVFHCVTFMKGLANLYFKLKPNPIVLNIKNTTCRWSNYKSSLMTSWPTRHTWAEQFQLDVVDRLIATTLHPTSLAYSASKTQWGIWSRPW